MSTARVRDLLERYKRLADERLRRDAERSLAAFVRQAWPILEPATPLLWNWHIDLVCEYLEAVTLGQITRLLINEPPRYMKSTKVSVLWPVWEWGPKNLPSTRWIFASFAMDLSTSHSISRRTVIESEWYRARWGERVQLTTDQNVKTEFQNTQRGRMLATSFSTGAMGKGGNRIVVDDPHKTRGVLSDTDREAVVREFREGLSDTRLDDKRTGAIVVVMQRLHQKDLSAYCLEQGYVHVKLENPCRKSVVITSPAGRPIQTTRDLPGFWAGSWSAVAKEMRGRYPRHPWPDDPAAASATLRTKKADARAAGSR